MKQLPVIVLAGYSCAGKSTLTAAISDKYGFTPMHQLPIYKDIATKKGYKRTREWLADVGNNVFVTETAVETARRISSLVDPKGVVIDASYGNVMHAVLRAHLPNMQIVVIAVLADVERRNVRMMGRMNAPRREAEVERAFRDAFLTDVGLEEVMKNANFAVNNTKGLDNAMEQVAEGFSTRGIV